MQVGAWLRATVAKGGSPSHRPSRSLAACPFPSPAPEMLHSKYGLTVATAARLSPLDREFAPSGALLRDLFCGLLRLAGGKAVWSEPPRAARLPSEESEVRGAGGALPL